MTWTDYMKGRLDEINARLKLMERTQVQGVYPAPESLERTSIEALWVCTSSDSTGIQPQALN